MQVWWEMHEKYETDMVKLDDWDYEDKDVTMIPKKTKKKKNKKGKKKKA